MLCMLCTLWGRVGGYEFVFWGSQRRRPEEVLLWEAPLGGGKNKFMGGSKRPRDIHNVHDIHL